MNDALRRQALTARAEVKTGALRGAALRERLLCVPPTDRDVWTDELLGLAEPPPDLPDLPRGAVPYLPTGVDEILRMVREVPLRPDDHLIDLGSGLGRVVILGHLLSGARACGVEIQPPLVAGARACCAALALTDVSFVHGNAAEVELEGSVFFFYAPFTGQTLKRVIRRLEDLARRRSIVVCAVDLEFPDVPWLQRRKTSSPALTLYDSRMPGVPGRASVHPTAPSF